MYYKRNAFEKYLWGWTRMLLALLDIFGVCSVVLECTKLSSNLKWESLRIRNTGRWIMNSPPYELLTQLLYLKITFNRFKNSVCRKSVILKKMAETFPSQKRIRRSTWSWCVRWKWRERLQNRSSHSWQDFTISFPSGWFQSLTSKSWSYWFLDYRTSTWMTWKPTLSTINTQRTHYRYFPSFLSFWWSYNSLITLSR